MGRNHWSHKRCVVLSAIPLRPFFGEAQARQMALSVVAFPVAYSRQQSHAFYDRVAAILPKSLAARVCQRAFKCMAVQTASTGTHQADMGGSSGPASLSSYLCGDALWRLPVPLAVTTRGQMARSHRGDIGFRGILKPLKCDGFGPTDIAAIRLPDFGPSL